MLARVSSLAFAVAFLPSDSTGLSHGNRRYARLDRNFDRIEKKLVV